MAKPNLALCAVLLITVMWKVSKVSGASSKRDLLNQNLTAAASANMPTYYEPRGDFMSRGSYSGGGGGTGGGYGSSGGSFGSGSGGGGGYGGGGQSYGAPTPSVYHYAIQPSMNMGWGAPMPMGWGNSMDEEGGGGFDPGLIGLLGLKGLKGLKGVVVLAKLILPLLTLLIPLLLPLLLVKLAFLFFLILLIPIPVITTTGRNLPLDSAATGKALLQDTLTDLMAKIPADLNQIISKIQLPEKAAAVVKEIKRQFIASSKTAVS